MNIFVEASQGSARYLLFKPDADFQIFIKAYDGKTMVLKTKFSDRIENLKQKICEQEKIPVDLIHISYFGKLLFDDMLTIVDYGITEGATLKLLRINYPKTGSDKRAININLPNGESYQILIEISKKVYKLKKMIQEKIVIPWDNQRIIFLKNELEDDKYLSDYLIRSSEEEINMYLITRKTLTVIM